METSFHGLCVCVFSRNFDIRSVCKCSGNVLIGFCVLKKMKRGKFGVLKTFLVLLNVVAY